MSLVNDLYHYWGNDLVASNGGDLLPVNATIRGQQRILRRLLTNPSEYIAHPDYGGGLPQYIGQTIDIGKIKAVIRSQLQLENSVAANPAPVIDVQQLSADQTGFSVTIQYNDAATNSPVVLSFNVSQ